MTRSPSVPCTRCGRLLWRGGRGCLPDDQRVCRPCRRAEQPTPRPGQTWAAKRPGRHPLTIVAVTDTEITARPVPPQGPHHPERPQGRTRKLRVATLRREYIHLRDELTDDR